MAMMETDTSVVNDEKLLFETTLDGAGDAVYEATGLKDVFTLGNVIGSTLCRPISPEPFPLENNIPSLRLPESDAGLYNDHSVNYLTTGHSTNDIVPAADEGFNEEKLLPSEHGEDAAGTDQSSGICSPNNMTPDSAEEPCNVTVVEIKSTIDEIVSTETSNLQCSDAGKESLVSNKKLCDTPLNDISSPTRHSNVFELAFLQNLEKPDASFSIDDAKQSSAGSNPLSERVASASVGGTEFLSERGARNISLHSLMSGKQDGHAESFSETQDCQQVSRASESSDVVEEDDPNETVRHSGISFHRDLQDDAKLWCQAYVKLVDCANLLLLTIPSVITDAIAEIKSPRKPKVECSSPVKSISPSKHSKDLVAASLPERIGKSHGTDASSLCDDTDSHSDRGTKKRQRRSRKAPENQTRARKSQSKSPRRIVFGRRKASGKRSHAEDTDEVICKLDAWKKLHKSKAKASKQSSMDASPSLMAHEIAVKQEPLDNAERLSIPSEYRLASGFGDAEHAQIKTELVSDTDAFAASHFGDGDQKPQLPLAELKGEIADYNFAFVKQEPTDDYLYMGACDTSNMDTDGITPLFPIDDVVSLTSVQVQVLGECYTMSEILQDDYWQPSVVLKRFPIWILQNLQQLAEEHYADNSPVNPPQSEEVSDSWSGSFVTQGSLQISTEYAPFSVTNGYDSESDRLTLNLDKNSVPHLSKEISLNHEYESSLRNDTLPSECVAQPLTKRPKAGPASKVRGSKRGKVKGQEQKCIEEESSLTSSESIRQSVTEVSTESGNTETPRRLGRPRRNCRMRLPMPEERENPLEEESSGKTLETEMSQETPVLTEKVPAVPAVDKKNKNEHRDNIPKAECGRTVRKRGRQKKEADVSEKLVEKAPKISDSKRILRDKAGEKVPIVEKKFRAGEEKKAKPKLGFVIPKKKPPDPNPVLSGTLQLKTNSDRVSSASTFLRIPKLSKALSEEDKERSVLAKLDTDIGKRETLKWNSHSSWTGKTSGTLSGNVAENSGAGSQNKRLEEMWQKTGVDRFRIQNFSGPVMRYPLGSQLPWQPKVPLLGFAPGINAVSSDWNRCLNPGNNEWMNIGVGGQLQNCAPGSFPSQPPGHRMDEQWPIPTIGCSIPVIQSSDRLTSNTTAEGHLMQQNCQGDRGMSQTESAPTERSEPVLREVPYVNDEPDEVFSSFGIDDDDDDDDKGTDRLGNGRPRQVLASSSSAVPQSFPLLGDLPAADNMDDSIRLFAEAVQEAIEQGDVSPEKCDRLVNLYEKLCRDLIADDVTENQQNAEAAGIICDTINQTMLKELRSSEDLTKRRGTSSSFGAVSDLLRNFGNVDKCPSRGSSVDYTRPKMTDQKPFLKINEDSARREKLHGFRSCKSNASGSYRQECNTDRASGSESFDGCTNRSFAILQDDALWRDLLAQAQSPGMSEESLELLRRLLLEAARRGVYDEQMVNMLNVVCQHIKLEDSKEESLRKEFGSCGNFQHAVCNESVEIPFINEEQHFTEKKGMSKRFCNEGDSQCATPVSPLKRRSYVAGEMNDSEPEQGIRQMLPKNRAAEERLVAEKLEQVKRKQEAFAAKVLDEIRLLETLIAIQCELAVVACPGVPPVTSRELPAEPASKVAKLNQSTESTGNLTDSCIPHVSSSELGKATELSAQSRQTPLQAAASIVEKASSESCDTPNLASEPLLCHPSTATAGDESQDSHSTQKSAKSTKEKDTVIDKKSCDPKAVEEKIIAMARNALKPHYHNGAITSEEFKLIMKKAITKICKSRSTDISQKRITKFMNAYVEKIIQSRK